VDVAFDRDGLIKELSQAAREPDFEATVQAMPKQVGAEKSAETGVRTNLVGEYRPRGHDEVCLYFGGSMATTRRGVTQNQAAGSCLTVVGTRFIALHAYENSADPQAYKNLLPGLKQWALRIHRVQPR